MTKLCGIYLITHIETGRKYVGQSRDITKRWQSHSKGNQPTWLGRSIAKHGWAEFSKSILELCDVTELNAAESRWISVLNCIAPYGLNLTSGGDARMPNAETRARLSAAQTGKKLSAETRAKMSAGRQNMCQAQRDKLSISSRNMSAETRSLISLAGIGRRHNQDSKDKIAVANTGVVFSAARKEKISATKIANNLLRKEAGIINGTFGRVCSEETKEKMRATKAANRLLRQNAAISSAGSLCADFVQRQ